MRTFVALAVFACALVHLTVGGDTDESESDGSGLTVDDELELQEWDQNSWRGPLSQFVRPSPRPWATRPLPGQDTFSQQFRPRLPRPLRGRRSLLPGTKNGKPDDITINLSEELKWKDSEVEWDKKPKIENVETCEENEKPKKEQCDGSEKNPHPAKAEKCDDDLIW